MVVGIDMLNTPVEQSRQEATIASIIGSHRLEGLELEPQVLDDMRRVMRNEITTEQAIQNAFSRIKSEEIQ